MHKVYAFVYTGTHLRAFGSSDLYSDCDAIILAHIIADCVAYDCSVGITKFVPHAAPFEHAKHFITDFNESRPSYICPHDM